MNTQVARTVSMFGIAGMFAVGAWTGVALAHADTMPSVNLTDVPWIDSLPVCHVEDCSDQQGQIGVWTSREGNAYIELGENVTVLVIDNTVTR